ncbi:MAG: hypothetical protein LW650_10780 [Planctomycetaceae bacterium]|nr:hypothetical protein [Planctomycetaceae bacterium]
MSRFVVGWVVLDVPATCGQGLSWLARCQLLLRRSAGFVEQGRVRFSEGGRAWPTLDEALAEMRAEADKLGSQRLEHCVVDLLAMAERADGTAVVAAVDDVGGVIMVGEPAWMVRSPAAAVVKLN